MIINNNKTRGVRILKQVTVLWVYLSLFTIQLSAILCSGNENNNQASFSFLQGRTEKDAGKQAAIIKQDNKANGRRCVFRPSKRFQPESSIICANDYTLASPEAVYYKRMKIGHPTAYLLFTVILAQSMRGPPVVA